MSTLEIKDLHVHVETKEGIKPILKGATLTVHSGETHAIMGPNGSGKSTLAYTLAGHPKYVVDSGEALLDGKDILKMTPDERAKAGLFLAMQYPVEIPGVSMTNFLRTAKTEIDGEAPGIRQWAKDLSAAMKRLKMAPKFASRSVNEGFSGGEKKRADVLQLELLKPKFAVLDETDSGLDVDALRIVSEGVNRAKEANQFGMALAVTRPDDGSMAEGRPRNKKEVVMECHYNISVTPWFLIQPSLLWISNPAGRNDTGNASVFRVQTILTF